MGDKIGKCKLRKRCELFPIFRMVKRFSRIFFYFLLGVIISCTRARSYKYPCDMLLFPNSKKVYVDTASKTVFYLHISDSCFEANGKSYKRMLITDSTGRCKILDELVRKGNDNKYYYLQVRKKDDGEEFYLDVFMFEPNARSEYDRDFRYGSPLTLTYISKDENEFTFQSILADCRESFITFSKEGEIRRIYWTKIVQPID